MCKQGLDQCEFEWVNQEIGRVRCKNCGFEKTTAQTDLKCVHVPCGAVKTQIQVAAVEFVPPKPQVAVENPIDGPSLVTKAWNYGKAILRMVGNGGPEQCSLEQIHERLEVCRTCPYFSPKPAKTEDEIVGVCLKCGCPCSSNTTNIFASKSANKTETCPDEQKLYPLGRWEEVDKKFR